MGQLQAILTTRGREVYVKMSLLLLLGIAVAPAFGQCPVPTDCPATYSQTINLDALPVCGQGTIGVRGDIGNATQQTTCLNGTLRCFEFIFHRTNATTSESLSFPIGQGAGCNGETDAIYTSINGTCSQVWAGGSNANVTLTFPIGVNDIKLYGCLNSASFIAICDLCRTPSCTPSVTCPTLNPTAVACAANVPAPANDAARFIALGGGAAITDCGQSVSVTSSDQVVPNSTCVARTLTRTYIITIGTYVQTCTIAYPILAPVTTFSSCPGAVTVSCVADVPPVNTALTATDNCGGTATVTANDVISSQTCANRYTLTRTYTATNSCGAAATCVQIITVNDQTAPMITCPAPVTVSCAASVPAADPTSVVSSDGCGGGAVTVIHVGDVPTTGTCANRYTIARTYRATDVCGNSSTCVQTITVNDQTAPVLTGTATLPNIACGATLPTATESVYTATDDCAGNVTVSASAWVLDATSNVCTGSIYKRIWTATDACGNASTKQQTIQMNPPTLPTMTAPANITGICGSLPAPTQLTFSNGSTGTCALTGLSAFSTFSTVPACAGTVIETWTMPASAATCNRTLQSVSRTINCNAGLSCATTKVKDANCDGFNGSATVTLTGGVASTYKWDTNETTATATALNQGLHSVTVTSTAGCITICNVMIGNTTNLECSVVATGTASCKGANGSATVTATGGASAIRFVWDNGETTATATKLTAGTHTVQTISGNCRKTCSVVIGTTGEHLKMGACSKTDATCGNKNGSVGAGVISGQAGTLSFVWRNAANEIVGTTERVSNLGAGTYTLTLKDACAEVTCSVTVGQGGAGFTCTATPKKAASCADNDGSATVTVTGAGAYTYSWDNGETTATATQLSSGVHRVTVTNAQGCESTCSVTIGSPTSTLYCTTTQTATTATVTIIGGNGTVTILWDNGETTATAVHLTPGVHKVVLTDQAGCTTGCSVTMAGDALSCTTHAVKHLKCSKDADGSAKVTVTGGTAPYKILWDNGETTAIATNLSIGEHSVTVTDSKGQTTTCSISIGCTAVELTMAACTKTNVTCKGEKTGSVTAGAVQGTGTLEYTWKSADHKVVGKTATVNNLPAGTYTLIVQNGCSSATCTVTVEKPSEICEEMEYHFYPAATTCCTYTNGSSQPLKFIGYKSNEHITEINPNVFYYYAKIVAPSKDFTVNIVQTKDESTFKFFGLSNDQIQLWDANCAHSVKGFATGNGQGKVSIKNAKIGSTYVLAVRLDTRALLKTACKKDAPKVTYTIASYINKELVAGSKGSIQLKPNHEQVRLNAGKCPKRAPEHDSSEESLVNHELLVQPNPAQSAVNVVFESVSAEMSVISVANVNGAIVQTMNHEAKQGENNVSLDIQNLPVGTYIVTVKTAHQWMNKQLVILR
jgi:Secretion system C-terminal sorting domain/SprB repeat